MLPRCSSRWSRRARLTMSSALMGGIPANTVPLIASSASERPRTTAATAAAPCLKSAMVSGLAQLANSLACWGVHLVEHLGGEVPHRLAAGDRLDDTGDRLVASGDVARCCR